MSGAPVLDLATGRVIGIMKRTQDPDQAIGAFVTGMNVVLNALPAALAKANHEANATPQRDDVTAIGLWGDLVAMAAAPLIDSAAARDALAEELDSSVNSMATSARRHAESRANSLWLTLTA